MKITAIEIKPGMIIEHKNDYWNVLKTQHVKPGKGGAFNQVELKSVIKGTKLNERFRSSETVEKAEVNEKKIDYQFMKKRLDNFEENKVDFTVLIENENSNEQLQVIDKSILAYALVEKNINEIPKEVVIDECIRLAKKFSNEKAYKYVNAKADILYDL